MALTLDAHFEPKRSPKTAHAAAIDAACNSFCYVYYYYAYQAMLEVRSSGG